MSASVVENVESWSGKDRGDENFPVGVIIRPDLRPHVHAYYAFARNADDIGDSPVLPPEEKIARLDHMEAVLLGRHEGGSPSATALRASLRTDRRRSPPCDRPSRRFSPGCDQAPLRELG